MKKSIGPIPFINYHRFTLQSHPILIFIHVEVARRSFHIYYQQVRKASPRLSVTKRSAVHFSSVEASRVNPIDRLLPVVDS